MFGMITKTAQYKGQDVQIRHILRLTNFFMQIWRVKIENIRVKLDEIEKKNKKGKNVQVPNCKGVKVELFFYFKGGCVFLGEF